MPPPRQPQRIDQVEPGFYRVRRVRNGPWTAAWIAVAGDTITLTQDDCPEVHVSAAEYADLVIDAVMEGEAFRHPLIACLWFGVPIDRAEYQHLIRLAQWARENQPDHPAANPTKRIDMGKVPITDIF